MKIKIHDREYEMTEEEFAKMYERILQDASQMQSFIRFLSDYAYIMRIAGEAVQGALVVKLHECLRKYRHFQPISKIRPILEKEMHAFESEVLCHYESMKQEYGPMSQVVR